MYSLNDSPQEFQEFPPVGDKAEEDDGAYPDVLGALSGLLVFGLKPSFVLNAGLLALGLDPLFGFYDLDQSVEVVFSCGLEVSLEFAYFIFNRAFKFIQALRKKLKLCLHSHLARDQAFCSCI